MSSSLNGTALSNGTKESSSAENEKEEAVKMAEVVSLEKERLRKILKSAGREDLLSTLMKEVGSVVELRMAIEEERPNAENTDQEGFLAGMWEATKVFNDVVSDFEGDFDDPETGLRQFISMLHEYKQETRKFYHALLQGLDFGINLIERIIEKRFLELRKS